MAVLGLDTLLLVMGVLPYVKLSKFFDAARAWLGGLQIVIPADLSGLEDVKRDEARLSEGRGNPNLVNRKKKRQAAPFALGGAKPGAAASAAGDRPNGPSLTCIRQPVALSKQDFYLELENALWIAGVGLATFAASEALYCLTNNRLLPGRQAATTLFACGVVVQCLAALVRVTAAMWRRMGNAENQLTLVAGLFSLMAAVGFMGIVSDTNVLPDLDFSPTASLSGPDGSRSSTWWLVALGTGACFALFAGTTLLPALRFSRIYHEEVAMSADKSEVCQFSPARKGLLHCAFFAPFLIVLLYVEPLVGEPLTQALFDGDRLAWQRLRSWLVLALATLRLLAFPTVVQGFLDSSYLVLQHMVGDPKRFSSDAIIYHIRSQYWLTSYAAVQYLLPTLATFFLALSRPRMSAHGWGACSGFWSTVGAACGLERPAERVQGPNGITELFQRMLPVSAVAAPGSALIAPELLGSLADLAIVWTCACWFIFSSLGMIYFRSRNTARDFAVPLAR